MNPTTTPVLFCHGLESGPIGRKSQGLIDLGYEVDAPDCRNQDLGQRVRTIVAAIEACAHPPMVVGSSFGGIAALVAAIVAAKAGTQLPGLVLCAPALQWPVPAGTADDLAPVCTTVIVHGIRDEVIPIDLSRSYARKYGLELIEVDDDHGLGTAGFAAIADVVSRLAKNFAAPV